MEGLLSLEDLPIEEELSPENPLGDVAIDDCFMGCLLPPEVIPIEEQLSPEPPLGMFSQKNPLRISASLKQMLGSPKSLDKKESRFTILCQAQSFYVKRENIFKRKYQNSTKLFF